MLLLLLLFLPLLALATPVPEVSRKVSLPLPDHLVHQFPKGTWLENIYVRSNGDLLVTALIPSAALFQISDPATANPTVTLIANFTSVNGLLGISETKPDTFVVFGGNFTSPGVQVNGTFSAWEVDLHHFHPHKPDDNNRYPGPPVRLITAIKPAAFLNGIATLPRNPTTVLISDSTLGVVWRLDTLTGRFDKALDFPQMKVAPGSSLAIGVNGIRIVRDDRLYWTNSFEQTIYRVRIDARTGSAAPAASLEKFANIKEAAFLDDFAVGADGTFWVCENVGNRLFAVRADGSHELVAGGVNQTTVAGDTAAAFGKGRADGKVLYVVTSGALAGPVNGTYTEGGKVVAVDTAGY